MSDSSCLHSPAYYQLVSFDQVTHSECTPYFYLLFYFYLHFYFNKTLCLYYSKPNKYLVRVAAYLVRIVLAK